MGSIKYAKYYNPNWGQYSKKRERWEKSHKNKTSTTKNTSKSSTSSILKNNNTLNKKTF